MTIGLYAGPNLATGNGVTTQFAYSFRILAETDLAVYVDGVLKAVGVDYTVDGVGESGGGDVHFISAPADTLVVEIGLARPYKRTAPDYQRGGSFDDETVEADFDAAQLQINQLAAATTRAFKAPRSVTADQVLTAAMWAARASKMLGFNSSGDFGAYEFVSPGSLVVSAFIETLLDDASGDAALVTLGALSMFVGGQVLLNGKLVASVAGNVLTVAVKTRAGADPTAASPVYILFQTATGVEARAITAALSMPVTSGSNLGYPAADTYGRIRVGALDNAGTVELFVWNPLSLAGDFGIKALDEGVLQSTTAEGGAGGADSAGTFYSTTARANVYTREIGYIDIRSGAVNGQWSNAPTAQVTMRAGLKKAGEHIVTSEDSNEATGSGTTLIPFDDTIPQVTEGDQVQALSEIDGAPKDPYTQRIITATAMLSNTAAGHMTLALFASENSPNAIGVGAAKLNNADDMTEISFTTAYSGAWRTTVPVTSATYQIRAGHSTAGTTRWNGRAGARLYGGAARSGIKVSFYSY